MIRNKGISLLIPILFLAMVALILSVPQEDAFSQLTFQPEGQEMSLVPWYSEEDDQYYLFLPSFLGESSVSATHPWYIRTHWEGIDPQDPIPVDQDITVTASRLFGRERTYTLRLLPCSARQTISIDAQDGMLSYLHADQDHVQNGFVTFWNQDGQIEHAEKAAISGRGNGTWTWEKKPYNLEFSNPITVGPFVDTKKLCLLAEYVDQSKLRNAAAYHSAQMLDFPYSTPYVYADLFLNGEYLGLYGMATKTEYWNHIEEDGIQAVFELSTSGKGKEFYTDAGKAIRVRYGSEDLICYKVEAMEAALAAQDEVALRQHVDLTSWAKKYAMDELFYNYDLSLTSQYFYLDGDGLIRCMLPWDYEWILYPRLYPHKMGQEYALSAYSNRPNWYCSLLEMEAYRDAVSEEFQSVYTDAYFEELTAFLEDCQKEIQDSWRCDLVRWGQTYSNIRQYESAASTFSSQPEEIVNGLRDRLAFLQHLFRNWDDFCLIPFYTELEGRQQEYALQLLLPRGTDFTQYHSIISESLYTPEGYEFLGVSNQDGVPLEDILTVTEDFPLFVHFRPVSSQEEVTP